MVISNIPNHQYFSVYVQSIGFTMTAETKDEIKSKLYSAVIHFDINCFKNQLLTIQNIIKIFQIHILPFV